MFSIGYDIKNDVYIMLRWEVFDNKRVYSLCLF